MEDVKPSNVEYVPEQVDLNDTGLQAFSDVFARFQLPPDETPVRIPGDTPLLMTDFLWYHTAGSLYRGPQGGGHLLR